MPEFYTTNLKSCTSEDHLTISVNVFYWLFNKNCIKILSSSRMEFNAENMQKLNASDYKAEVANLNIK